MNSTESVPGRAQASLSTVVVALDGPSGTGKSTVARSLAQRLGIRYLDTGATYRAATVAVLEAGVLALGEAIPGEQQVRPGSSLGETVTRAQIEVSTDPFQQRTLLDGRDVTTLIRSAEVTGAVSVVAADPQVRSHLVDLQRTFIGAGGIVVEGRDIASVVWPAASPKIYLTASETVRATRRARDLPSVDTAAVLESLRRRDAFDSSRAVSPLHMTADSLEVDTSDLSIDAVVDRLVDLVLARQVGVPTAIR